MLKCAVQVMRWRDTRAHRPAICTRNRCTHYVQFNEQPLLTEASTILGLLLAGLQREGGPAMGPDTRLGLFGFRFLLKEAMWD